MTSFRMMAVSATFGALPAARRLSYLAFRSALKPQRPERACRSPGASGVGRRRRSACRDADRSRGDRHQTGEAGGAAMLQVAELRQLDYDKLAENYLAGVKLASTRIWLRHNESVT